MSLFLFEMVDGKSETRMLSISNRCIQQMEETSTGTVKKHSFEFVTLKASETRN